MRLRLVFQTWASVPSFSFDTRNERTVTNPAHREVPPFFSATTLSPVRKQDMTLPPTLRELHGRFGQSVRKSVVASGQMTAEDWKAFWNVIPTEVEPKTVMVLRSYSSTRRTPRRFKQPSCSPAEARG